jgi:hypothetical protein
MNTIREAAYWKTWYFTRSKFETRARARVTRRGESADCCRAFLFRQRWKTALGHMADEAQSTHGELT